MAEYWDIYDADRIKTNRKHLRGEPIADGNYHLVVNIWIYNSQGKVLLTQRHPDIPFPLKWACTGGSALAGEDTLTAAIRETREEIGLILSPDELIPAGQERRLHSFLDTFIVCRDVLPGEIVMQPEEVVDFCWVNESQYRKMQREGLLHPALKNFFEVYREKIPRNNPFGKKQNSR